MKFKQYIPSDILKPYIKYYVVSESNEENHYKVLPSNGLVMGFQYTGRLLNITDDSPKLLSQSGITGISGSFKIFQNKGAIGTVLVYFRETGYIRFSDNPAHELFDKSISLDLLFSRERVTEVEEKLSESETDEERIAYIELFLRHHLKTNVNDSMIVEAIRIIESRRGNIRIKELMKYLATSQSPLEKRFRSIVGTTPKKFAEIIRFQNVLKAINKGLPLGDIAFEHNYYDQAHFSKDFKIFAGEAPEKFIQNDKK